MQLIGINGFKGSGKGTAAEMVAEFHPSRVKLVGFSDKLKIVAGRALGIRGNDLEIIAALDVLKDTGVVLAGTKPHDARTYSLITGRHYIQNLGETARRMFGEDFWVNQVLPAPAEGERNTWRLENYYPFAMCVVLTDLRYPNEAQRVKDLGGQVWEVVRPGVKSDGHSSEQPLPTALVDRVIVNAGDIEDLRAMVEIAVHQLDG